MNIAQAWIGLADKVYDSFGIFPIFLGENARQGISRTYNDYFFDGQLFCSTYRLRCRNRRQLATRQWGRRKGSPHGLTRRCGHSRSSTYPLLGEISSAERCHLASLVTLASSLRRSRHPRDQRNPLSHHLHGAVHDRAQRPPAESFTDHATQESA